MTCILPVAGLFDGENRGLRATAATADACGLGAHTGLSASAARRRPDYRCASALYKEQPLQTTGPRVGADNQRDTGPPCSGDSGSQTPAAASKT